LYPVINSSFSYNDKAWFIVEKKKKNFYQISSTHCCYFHYIICLYISIVLFPIFSDEKFS
jgi:hypothetical protein